MEETASIGRVVATIGLQGNLVVKHSLGKKSNLKGVTVIFLSDRSGSKIPFFIKEVSAKSAAEMWIQLEGIGSREQAIKLIHREVWLKQTDFEKQVAANAPIGLIGYQITQGGQNLGVITEIIEQPHQVIAIIFINKKEVLIPLHENSLQGIDRKSRVVQVNLPEGLIELYLQ